MQIFFVALAKEAFVLNSIADQSVQETVNLQQFKDPSNGLVVMITSESNHK